MIAFEVRLNGKRVCIAGAEDLSVLNTIITASGKLGRRTVPARPDDTTGEVFYSVGGLTGRPDPRRDVHVSWKSVSYLRVGDVLQVKVLETEKADRPRARVNAEKARARRERARKKHNRKGIA